MKLRQSRVLKRLRNGQFASCMKLNLSDPRVVEICGLAGIDAIWLCNEHVLNDWLNLENQVRAAKLHDVDTIVRVSKGSYSDYIKPFEADATGIMVPHVKNAAEARKIVQWTRFQPIGQRPLDGGNIDGRFCQIDIDDYLRHSNHERFIILQIESPEALENVEEIAAVDGYDMLLFGAGDFSQLIGKAGQRDIAEVVEARQRVGRAARDHGKFGMLAGMTAPRKVHQEEGYSLLKIGADVVELVKAVEARLKDFNE